MLSNCEKAINSEIPDFYNHVPTKITHQLRFADALNKLFRFLFMDMCKCCVILYFNTF
jgi:hypothetical protein